MKKYPLVSIIIPVKNPGEVIFRVLSGIYSQNYEGQTEVIIIDSGSTDGSLEKIKEYTKNLNNTKIIQIPSKDFGHGKTRNLGISKAGGELVAVITHDATPANSSWLKNMVQPFLENSDVAGVFGRHIAYENADIFTKQELVSHFDSFNKTPPITYFRFEQNSSAALNNNLLMYYYFFSDNNAMLKKSVWNNIPYEDVNFGEDQLWAKSILEAGYIKAYADSAIVYHSHNYNLNETFRRSFEEAAMILSHFNYLAIPSILSVFIASLSKTLFDFKIIKNEKGMVIIDKIYQYAIRPIFNFVKFSGYYLGSKKILNSYLYSRISLDQRLLKKGIGRRG